MQSSCLLSCSCSVSTNPLLQTVTAERLRLADGDAHERFIMNRGRLLIKYDSKVSSFMFFNRKQIWRAVTVVKVTVRALGEVRLDYEWSCLIDWVWPGASSFQPTIVSLRDLQGSKLIESLLPSFSVLPWTACVANQCKRKGWPNLTRLLYSGRRECLQTVLERSCLEDFFSFCFYHN